MLATPALAIADLSDPGWYTVPEADAPRTVVITGANSGIGFAAAGKLAAAGNIVYLVCRTQEKAGKACQSIEVSSAKNGTIALKTHAGKRTNNGGAQASERVTVQGHAGYVWAVEWKRTS